MRFILKETESVSRYIFGMDDNLIYFEVVNFYGLDDYRSFLEEDTVDIFEDFEDVDLISAYDWDFKVKNNINIFKLVSFINVVGKDFIRRKQPDIVFYYAENKKLHTIYSRLLNKEGYFLVKEIDNRYIFKPTR